jgi:DNA-binding HxlR family transcriptional regulator
MTKRTYGQHCAIARALDRIGDRWTLLLVRELLIGPKRFKDLEAALPGVLCAE